MASDEARYCICNHGCLISVFSGRCYSQQSLPSFQAVAHLPLKRLFVASCLGERELNDRGVKNKATSKRSWEQKMWGRACLQRNSLSSAALYAFEDSLPHEADRGLPACEELKLLCCLPNKHFQPTHCQLPEALCILHRLSLQTLANSRAGRFCFNACLYT